MKYETYCQEQVDQFCLAYAKSKAPLGKPRLRHLCRDMIFTMGDLIMFVDIDQHGFE